MMEKLRNWWRTRKYEREQQALALEQTMRRDENPTGEAPDETYLSQLRD
jgi:hypothetical protein